MVQHSDIDHTGITGVGDSGAAHIADASDAHDASAISVADSGGNFDGTDVEAVLAELQDNIDAVGGGSGIATGTSFPGSPSTNDLYFRTDRGLLYYYDGTRWLTVTRYLDTPPPADGFSPIANTGGMYRWPDNPNFDVYIIEVQCLTFVGSPNDGSKFWTVAAIPQNAANSDLSSLGSFTTASDSAGTWVSHIISVGAVLGSTALQVNIRGTKTSTPGVLYCQPRLSYRLVG